MTYLYFPKGKLKAVFGMEDLSNGMWQYPALKSNVVKYLDPFNLENMFFDFWHGPSEFPGNLVKSSVIDN